MEYKKPPVHGKFERKILESTKLLITSNRAKELIKALSGNPKNSQQYSDFEKATALTKLSERKYPQENSETTIYSYSRNNVRLTIIQEVEKNHYLKFTPTLFYQEGDREEVTIETEKKVKSFFKSRS